MRRGRGSIRSCEQLNAKNGPSSQHGRFGGAIGCDDTRDTHPPIFGGFFLVESRLVPALYCGIESIGVGLETEGNSRVNGMRKEILRGKEKVPMEDQADRTLVVTSRCPPPAILVLSLLRRSRQCRPPARLSRGRPRPVTRE